MQINSRLSKFSSFSRLAFALLLSAPIILAGTRASGQVDRAVLEGTVTDPSGSVIVGATLKVLAVDTGLKEEQPTNSKGYYRFPGLAVGRYTVTVTGNGFKTKVVEDVVLRVGQTRTLDVELAVGGISEKIEVKATLAPTEIGAGARIGSHTIVHGGSKIGEREIVGEFPAVRN